MGRRYEEPISLGRCKGIRDTPDALLVEADRGNTTLDHLDKRQLWIPKSVLADGNEVEEFERGECFVEAWWARDNGIDE